MGAQKSLGRTAAQADNASRLNSPDFGHNQRLTSGQFFRRGRTIGSTLILPDGWSELAYIGNINITTLQAHGAQYTREQLPRRADKWLSLAFFLIAGGFPHQHEAGMRIPYGKNHSIAQGPQTPCRLPVCRTLAQICQFLLHAHFLLRGRRRDRGCITATTLPGILHPLPQNSTRIIIHSQSSLPGLYHVGKGLYGKLLESGHAYILAQAFRIARKSVFCN